MASTDLSGDCQYITLVTEDESTGKGLCRHFTMNGMRSRPQWLLCSGCRVHLCVKSKCNVRTDYPNVYECVSGYIKIHMKNIYGHFANEAGWMKAVSKKRENSSNKYMANIDFFSTEKITVPIGFRLFAIA